MRPGKRIRLRGRAWRWGIQGIGEHETNLLNGPCAHWTDTPRVSPRSLGVIWKEKWPPRRPIARLAKCDPRQEAGDRLEFGALLK